MPFELRFFREQGRAPLLLDEVREALSSLPDAVLTPTDTGGVVAEICEAGTSLSFRASWEAATGAGPEGYADAGLRMEVDYARPSFFADAAIWSACHVAKKRDLYFLTPAAREDDLPDRPTADHVFREWEIGNRAEIARLREEEKTDLAWAPREVLTEWSRYQRVRDEIEEGLQEEKPSLFVPQLFLLRPRGGGPVVRMIPWPQAQPTVVPQGLEVVFLQRTRTGGLFNLRRIKEHGAVPWSAVRPHLEPYLERRDRPVPHWVFRRSPAPPVLLDALLDLPLGSFEDFEGISVEKVVDVPPPKVGP